ncbi:MAG TPA: TetR/AcrR family transcriptional regulator [Candidatus Dormibacteraeota bacterium]|nr:TetR/AcrR family transcriptional regulator [Candidatus Dormibacteraeota bacterium]
MSQRSRPYNSPVRSRQAQGTRQAILAAARSLFAQGGYQATTIESIAAAAEVSVPTVYATLGTKQGILAALVDGAVADPQIRLLAEAVERELDPVRRLRGAARVMTLALQSESELTEILWQAGAGNPELLAAWRQSHGNRHRRLSEVFAPLAVGARRKHFVDLAWAFGSPEMYRLFVGERRWTPEQFEKWLAGSLVALYRE